MKVNMNIEAEKMSKELSLKSLILICLSPVLLFAVLLISNESFRQHVSFDIKRDSMTTEIQKISYIKTMIDTGLYKETDVEKFQNIVNKKDIYAFGNEKSKYHYNLSENNEILNISLTFLTPEQCQSMFIESTSKSTQGLLVKFNGINIKNSGIKTIPELKTACDKKGNTFSYEISKIGKGKV